MDSIQPHKSGGSSGKRRAGGRHSSRDRGEWGYLIMWEFQVRTGMEKRFAKIYGAEGDWARLFHQDASYIGTELIHHFNGEQTYVTLDFWTSPQAYDKFRKQHLANYKALDRKCEALTESEREIGRFVRVSNK
jgi:heme-degrading monooxygenase HmoA